MENSFSAEDFTCKPGKYRGEKVLWLHFEPSTEREAFIRAEFGAYWSPPQRAWYVQDSVENRRYFAAGFNLAGKHMLTKIDTINHEALYAIQRKMVQRGYALSTIYLYTRAFAYLLYLLGSRPVQSLTATEYNSYYLYCLKEKLLSSGEIENRISVHSFYLKYVNNQAEIARALVHPSKHGKKLLNVNVILNKYHPYLESEECVMAVFSFTLGMTVKELVALKTEHVDWESRRILVYSESGQLLKELTIPGQMKFKVRDYISNERYRKYDCTFFFSDLDGPYSERKMLRLLQNIKKHFYTENKRFRYGELAQYRELLLAAGAVEAFFEQTTTIT